MASGFGAALAQSSERAAQVNERIAVSRMVAAGRARAGAKWFYCIAGLAMIKSVLVVAGSSFHWVIGLGITSFVDTMAKRVGSIGSVVDFVIDACVGGLFLLFGTFAVRAQKWAFVLGMAIYGLDGLLLLGVKDYLSLGFHAYALYAIYGGYTAAKRIQV
jgi:hypothetical protein